jgi:hypothetical protein
MRVSLACSSRWNWDQERSQYAPLKITYMIELVFNLSKITSFRHRQIAQHSAATPTQIKPFKFLGWLLSQEPSKWLMDLGWFRLVAKKIICQIVLAKGQSRNRCWIFSFLLQLTHFWLPFQFILARLSLVRTTSLCTNQRKIFIFSGILIFQIFQCWKGGFVSIRWWYNDRTVYKPDFVRPHLNKSEPSVSCTCEIRATNPSQSLRLLSTRALLKEIFRGLVVIILEIVACGSLAILYKFGYWILSGLSLIQVSSQNLTLVPSFITKEPKDSTSSFICMRPLQKCES